MLKQVIIIWLSWQDNASEASNIFAKKTHREICQFFMYQMASQFCLNFRAKIYNFIFKQILPTKYVVCTNEGNQIKPTSLSNQFVG